MKLNHPVALGLLHLTAVLTLAPLATADGTESLGLPGNVVVAQGSSIHTAGAAFASSTASLQLTLPNDTVTQAFLYWESQAANYVDLRDFDPLLVDSQVVVGQSIGGPTRVSPPSLPDVWTASYRADLTGLVPFAPGYNAFTITESPSAAVRSGISLVAILGQAAGDSETHIMDGNDFACANMTSSLGTTTPVIFNFAPSPVDRQCRLHVLAATSDTAAPSALFVQFPGKLATLKSLFPSSSSSLGFIGGTPSTVLSPGWADVAHTLQIPAGSSSVAVRVVSMDAAFGGVEAEIRWVSSMLQVYASGLALEGCTPGYWKQPQHFDSWPPPCQPTDLFEDTFGVNSFPGLTLLDVLSLGGGKLNALGRHAVAALLNAKSPDVNYPMTPQEVTTFFQNVNLPMYYEVAKDRLEFKNSRGCPLN